jgi:hypothetical protein
MNATAKLSAAELTACRARCRRMSDAELEQTIADLWLDIPARPDGSKAWNDQSQMQCAKTESERRTIRNH